MQAMWRSHRSRAARTCRRFAKARRPREARHRKTAELGPHNASDQRAGEQPKERVMSEEVKQPEDTGSVASHCSSADGNTQCNRCSNEMSMSACESIGVCWECGIVWSKCSYSRPFRPMIHRSAVQPGDVLEVSNGCLFVNGKHLVVEYPDEPLHGIDENGKLVTLFKGHLQNHWDRCDIKGHWAQVR